MATDHYSPCPCGSGKKLKFCKCVENPQDFDKLVRLIEGGQEVAALDRINQMLKKTPNAAWLLAIKGELTFGMQEIDSFRETANRFLKLKPDNPLALIMQSIVCALEGKPLENAARYLLEGMAESRESLPGLALTAIQILIRALASSGKLPMVGYWADVLAALTGEQGPQEDSVLLDPQLNLIAKAPAKIIDDPAGSPWKERLAEVLVLARTFRYDQAEKKLQAILRDFPNQPGPLSHLLRAQYAQLDQAGAMATARKLADHVEIAAVDRAYFAAVALELEPNQKMLQTPMLVRYCEIDSEDRLVEALNSLDFVAAADGEGMDQAKQYFAYLVQDEVPARRIFNIYDHAIRPESSDFEGKDLVISSAGTIVLYAKQTDRPARALLLANQFPAYAERTAQVLDVMQLGTPASEAELPINSVYTEFLQRPRILPATPGQMLSVAAYSQLVVEEFLTLPFAALDLKSPLDVAADENYRSILLGLLSHLEGEQGLVITADAMDDIYQRLGLERPAVAVNNAAPSLKLVSVLDLERIRLEQVSPQQLKGLMLRAMSMGASRVCYRCSLAALTCDELAADQNGQILALTNLLTLEPSLEKKLEFSYLLEAKMLEHKMPVGRLILQRMSILHALERTEEAQAMMLEALQKYPEDPFLMNFLQYAMQEQGMQGGSTSDQLANRMLQNSARPAEQESGLVLPGQSSNSASESKLWLPGS